MVNQTANSGDVVFGEVVFIDEPELVRAIRARAPDAHIVILPSDGRTGTSEPALPAAEERFAENLTRREQDVLERVATGGTNAEIAQAMGLAQNTVKAYLQSLMRKLGARNRVEALAFARTYGIL